MSAKLNAIISTLRRTLGLGKLASLFLTAICFTAASPASAQVLSNSVYKPINKAQEAMAEESFAAAQSILDELLARGENLEGFDRAKTLQLLMTVYVNQDQYPQAIDAAEKALALNVLDAPSVEHLRSSLVSLHMAEENYTAAIKHLEIWFKETENPAIGDYFRAARLHALTNQWEKALTYANQGLTQGKQRGVSFKPSWYELVVAIHLQREDVESARDILEILIRQWPDQGKYYRQLSGIYHQLEQQKMALVILSIGYQNEVLERGENLERLAQMYRYVNYPYIAGVILQDAYAAEVIEPKETEWAELASTWRQAREWQSSETALQKAARLSDAGHHWLRLCQTAARRQDWHQAKQYCQAAIKQGNLAEETDDAWQMAALTHYRTDKLESSREAIEQCLEINPNNRRCLSWREYLETLAEQKRSQELQRRRQQERQQQRENTLEQEIQRALN